MIRVKYFLIATAIVLGASVDIKAQNKQQAAAPGTDTDTAAVAPPSGGLKQALAAGMICKGYFSPVGDGINSGVGGALWLESTSSGTVTMFVKQGKAAIENYLPPTRDGYESRNTLFQGGDPVVIQTSRRSGGNTWQLTRTSSNFFKLKGQGVSGGVSTGEVKCFGP